MKQGNAGSRCCTKFNRRGFLTQGLAGLSIAGIAGASVPRQPDLKPFELEEATIAGLQEGIRSGKYSVTSIARHYLDRIEEIDRQGPSVNSVIEINPDALAMVRSLDEERKSKGPRGPLHGIPVLIKDNIDTADRMRTSAGSLALAESVAAHDAFIVGRLRDAGAVTSSPTGGTGHYTELTCTYKDGSQKTFPNEEVGLKGLAASFTAAGICGGLGVLFFMTITAIIGARLVKLKEN